VPDGFRACLATFISVILTTYQVSCDAIPCTPDKLLAYGQKHQAASLEQLGVSLNGDYFISANRIKQSINSGAITIINIKDDSDLCVLGLSADEEGAEVLNSRGKKEFYPDSRIRNGATILFNPNKDKL
jgi:hypothetical protein